MQRGGLDMTVPRNLGLALLTFLAVGMSASTPAAAQKKPNVVMADDRRHWMERFRSLYGWRRGPWPPDPEHRPDRQGRRGVHELVRSGELHGRPRLIHDRAHPDPLGTLDRGGTGRRECAEKGDAHHRGILPEERLFDVFFWQVASRRQARGLSDRARLRRDEGVRRLLSGRLHLR